MKLMTTWVVLCSLAMLAGLFCDRTDVKLASGVLMFALNAWLVARIWRETKQ